MFTQVSKVRLVPVGSVPSETFRAAGVAAPWKSSAGPTFPTAPALTAPRRTAVKALLVEST